MQIDTALFKEWRLEFSLNDWPRFFGTDGTAALREHCQTNSVFESVPDLADARLRCEFIRTLPNNQGWEFHGSIISRTIEDFLCRSCSEPLIYQVGEQDAATFIVEVLGKQVSFPALPKQFNSLLDQGACILRRADANNYAFLQSMLGLLRSASRRVAGWSIYSESAVETNKPVRFVVGGDHLPSLNLSKWESDGVAEEFLRGRSWMATSCRKYTAPWDGQFEHLIRGEFAATEQGQSILVPGFVAISGRTFLILQSRFITTQDEHGTSQTIEAIVAPYDEVRFDYEPALMMPLELIGKYKGWSEDGERIVVETTEGCGWAVGELAEALRESQILEVSQYAPLGSRDKYAGMYVPFRKDETVRVQVSQFQAPRTIGWPVRQSTTLTDVSYSVNTPTQIQSTSPAETKVEEATRVVLNNEDITTHAEGQIRTESESGLEQVVGENSVKIDADLIDLEGNVEMG